MKSVLISIKPTWCAKISSGEKTIEVRRTRPKLDVPFLCHIYCTSVKSMPLDPYVKLHSQTGGAVDEWSGKVFGSFICGAIYEIGGDAIPPEFGEKACLPLADIHKYVGQHGYGWQISEMQVYDKPLELGELGITRPPQSWCYVEEKEAANVSL